MWSYFVVLPAAIVRAGHRQISLAVTSHLHRRPPCSPAEHEQGSAPCEERHTVIEDLSAYANSRGTPRQRRFLPLENCFFVFSTSARCDSIKGTIP